MREITTCRACWSDQLIEFLDLGEQYISDFREDASKPPKYPLVAVICNDCKLVQLRHTTPQPEMYHDNYGFKSGISDSIKDDLKDVVSTALEFVEGPGTWLDIASNDGTLLSYVPDGSMYRVGVDPVTKYCEEAKQHADLIVNDFFTERAVRELQINGFRKFDVITSISCFYDMPQPNDFVNDVASVLAENGVWVIQQNYLLPTLLLGAVDNFCHEHLEYYTLLSLEPLLERHGLEVVEVSVSNVNGGSIRTIVAHKGHHNIQESVEYQRQVEQDEKLDDIETYERFGEKAGANIEALRNLVDDLKEEGYSIAILAASTRGATIWQCAGLTEAQIDYAVERNPEKVGKYFSAIGVKIVSEERFRKDKPDYAIIGPWFFADEIADREELYLEAGGRLITPLPEVRIIA